MTTTQLPAAHIAILREMARGDGSLPVDTLRGLHWDVIQALLLSGAIEQRKPQWAGSSYWCITELGRKEARKG
jgi:hypothetical protein